MSSTVVLIRSFIWAVVSRIACDNVTGFPFPFPWTMSRYCI